MATFEELADLIRYEIVQRRQEGCERLTQNRTHTIPSYALLTFASL